MAKRWVGCDVEEQFFGDDRKLSKSDRKKATAKDRSQYKKTDQAKLKKSDDLHKNIKISKESLVRGRVLSINPQGIVVEHENKKYTCSLRGLLKKDKTQFKNLVTVGDFVLFEIGADDEGLIAHVEPRNTVLSRADNLSRRKEQLIASNIDQVLITMSVVSPEMKPYLADRYIIAAQKGGMDPVIIVNKIDLLDDPSIEETLKDRERELFTAFLEAYKSAGIPVIPVSVSKKEGLDALRDVMRDKASVFSGQSGVGKSSLINAITGLDLRIGDVVEKTKKGSHTTTAAQLIPLTFGGWVIDTPGIKSFGVWDLKQDEIEKYFTEIHTIGRTCKYPNCTHTQENDCAVLQAIDKGEISPLRYQSFQILMESVSQTHKRR